MADLEVIVESVSEGGLRARSPRGPTLAMGPLPGDGGPGGWQPVELLMAALAGCMAMDVETILERSRAHPAGVRITVRPTGRSDDVPGRPILGFELTHEWRSAGASDVVDRAIRLAAERYCTVQLTLQRGPEISHRIAPTPASRRD